MITPPPKRRAAALALVLCSFVAGPTSCEEISEALQDYDYSRVVIFDPADGSVFTSPQTVTILADVDPALAPNVTQVAFFDHYAVDQPEGHGTPNCIDKHGPVFSCEWRVTAADNGPHYWNALAYVDGHPGAFSAPVELNVDIQARRLGPPSSHVPSSCTDGVDCYCDCVEGRDRGDGFASDACAQKQVPTDRDLALCEDFELSSLDQNGGPGWFNQWPGVVNGCHNGREDFINEVEGTCPNCCVNVVKNDACEVPGQTGCVLDGAQTMGRRFIPGQTMGIVGERPLPTGQHFGATVAVKFSRNFVNASSPKKTTEFGRSGHCPFGCSSGNQVSRTAGSPFGGVIFTTESPSYDMLLGQVRAFDVAMDWAATPATYDFDRDHGIDEWHCWKVHIANIGQENATIRHWIDDELLVHLTGVDLTTMTTPFDTIMLNHYYNDGYPGSDVAYRYEDNYHVTLGPEPASCAQIGVSASR